LIFPTEILQLVVFFMKVEIETIRRNQLHATCLESIQNEHSLNISRIFLLVLCTQVNMMFVMLL
jgi:hypothetical protein